MAWSISPSGTGSISAAGLYTAPATIASQQTVTVTATSQADNTKTGAATIALNPPVAISVAPATSTVTAGQTQQFTAVVTGTPNTTVTWSISPAGTGSTISTAGLFTAPPAFSALQTVTVTATSQADTSKTASATITLNPPVIISPAGVTLIEAQTQQFTANVPGSADQTVTWSLFPTNAGSINAAGLYTTPATLWSTARVTVKALSQANNSLGTVNITIKPSVAIAVTPATTTLTPTQTQQFTATVTALNTAVDWSISPASAGTISASGLYTAPATIGSQQTVTLIVTSQADRTKTATATITLNPPVTISVTPPTSTLTAGQTQQFTANVTGTANTAVTWSIIPTSTGTITAGGLYTAPATIASQQSVTVTATSQADTSRTATATVTLNPPVTISLTPTTSSLTTGQTQQFTAAITGSSNTAATWSISPANTGTISTAGLYTVPATIASQQTVTVTARSQADTAKTATATITLNPPRVITLVAVDPPAAGPQIPISVTASGFQTGVAIQNAIVTLTPQGGGSVVAIPGSGQGTGLGRSVNFAVPTSAPAGNYNLTVSATGYASSNSLAFTVYPPATISLSPASAKQGETLQVIITGTYTTFPPNQTRAKFGPGISVGGAAEGQLGPVTVLSDTTARADLFINPDAATGARDVELIGPFNGINFIEGFSVNAATTLTVTSVSPSQPWATGPLTTTASGFPSSGSVPALTVQFSPLAAGGTAFSTTASVSGTATTRDLNLTLPSSAAPGLYAVRIYGSGYRTAAPFNLQVTSPPPVSVTVTPTAATLQGGQTQQFTATLSNTSNTAVTWSMTPSGVGTISTAGLYTAPATIASQQTVTVTATSQADTGKTATATITLNPVTISVTPATSTLTEGQTQQFTANVTGTTNSAVTWSISPTGAGTISTAGLYTAPATIASQQTVTVTATSQADTTKTATATITLNPPVVISLSPATSTLTGGQTQQFAASVTGTANTAVTWSISPAGTGSISATGLYTAPATIASQQTVIVTATSQADTSKTATATITLNPVTISLTPATSTLSGGQTQQFTANVTGTANTAVTWSISPAGTGSISAAGLYTAPATIASQQTLTVTATSQADTSKTATATVTLNPPVTISVTPATSTLAAGQTQQFTANVTGTANTAVAWSISPAGTGTISTAGLYTAPATIASQQTVTVTATSQADTSKTATATITLNPPVVISVSPSTRTLTPGQTVQFTANVTGTANTAVTWSISPAGTGSISAAGLYTAPATIVSPQTVTVTATSAADPTKSATATTTLNPPPPQIMSVSPTSGVAGTQVAITGSGFGATRGSGGAWLGSTFGTIVSWSNTQIVATVASNARSGSVQVQQYGAWSNSLPFNVSTATITNVTPTIAAPGTAVTITGSGFGSAQGAGQVWLGTLNGVVQSWSDTQVVALVATDSASGKARILQGGVMSNGVAFTVSKLQITSVSPASAAPGASVTITGMGFGSSQGVGSVLLGGTAGQVVSWSDTQIVAQVAANAGNGVVRVQQNGSWSNALTFAITGSTVTLQPNLFTLSAGDTRPIQALGMNGQPVSGLTWTSSDPNIVQLSAADPPVLTAVAAGRATITAGSASADVTVVSGSLPLGAVLWSVPGAFSRIVPAVPSPTGAADVFAFQNETVQAITSDGVTAWTGDASHALDPASTILPDFQGGLVLAPYVMGSGFRLYRLDGMTGQRHDYSLGSNTFSNVRVHPDSTIFAVVEHWDDSFSAEVVGLDLITGAEKFRISPPGLLAYNFADMIIAGDGNAYLPYLASTALPDGGSHDELKLLQVGANGSSRVIDIEQRTSTQYIDSYFPPDGDCCPWSSAWEKSLISNGADGVLLSWLDYTSTGRSSHEATWHQAVVSSAGGVTITAGPRLPGQDQIPMVPMLQRQDGTFVGWAWIGAWEADYSQMTKSMAAFDASGNVLWSVPNEEPQMALEDGGVIAKSGVVYDQNGNARGIMDSPPPKYSWTGDAYEIGSVKKKKAIPPDYAASFAAVVGGNLSSPGTFVPTLGFIYRTKIAQLAKTSIGDSSTWCETSLQRPFCRASVTCNLFVRDILSNASDATSLQIPFPTRPTRYRFGIPRTDAFLAADWANPTKDAACWKVLPGGPDTSRPGDVLATGYPPGGHDGTGHVGIIVDPSQVFAFGQLLSVKLASAASGAPYWWDAQAQSSFIPGTITLTDYGFRLPGFNPNDPQNVQGLKQDSTVRRFTCY